MSAIGQVWGHNLWELVYYITLYYIILSYIMLYYIILYYISGLIWTDIIRALCAPEVFPFEIYSAIKWWGPLGGFCICKCCPEISFSPSQSMFHVSYDYRLYKKFGTWIGGSVRLNALEVLRIVHVLPVLLFMFPSPPW